MSVSRTSFTAIGGLLGTIAILLLAGCNDRGLDIVAVHGRVTLGGEGWQRRGLVFFTPIEPESGYPLRAGMASFDTNGDFQVTTFEPGDGLIPGRYTVGVKCWEVPPTMGGAPGKNFVPKKYQHGSTSGFEIVVSSDDVAPRIVEFDVPRQ